MKRRIVFATGNAGKMREIREILLDLDLGSRFHERNWSRHSN